jgi:hypothetical protein
MITGKQVRAARNTPRRLRKKFVIGLALGATVLAGLVSINANRVQAPPQQWSHQGITQQTCKQIHDANDINEARAIASTNAKYLAEAAQREGSLDRFAERCFALSGDLGWWLGQQ